ncbi:ribokinase [Sporohalobacter salinus]|uniref:ribokinase n=1 Tax=Sporohalobacter salinus TaxID=1494606 RepID=UPI001961B141|nr:ribokinase [Sporohalobacter salinus]MBM7622546.1 ribokinase [Sporohalobacter salinus]
MNEILVIGSMNMDLVVQAETYPQAGETILGSSFDQIPGGKGANQAVAVGRLEGDVGFIGACGNDDFGDKLLTNLNQAGVNIDNIFRTDINTGIAAITVEESGENRIIVVPGANHELTPTKINSLEDRIGQAEVILLQLEIPLETILHIVDLAENYQTKVILDPAPAQKLPEGLYSKVDYILPNEGELDTLIDCYEGTSRDEKIETLLNLGVKKVLLTCGSKGVSLYTKEQQKDYPAVTVEVVDTTAAGDAFAGAFAYGLQQGWNEDRSIKFASQIAALAVTKLGAQSSLPKKREVRKFQQERGI